MAYELLPGVKQDHRGRTYQLGRYPSGKLVEVPVNPWPLNARTEAELKPILVETQSRLILNKDKEPGEVPNLPWVEKALENGTLFKRGDTYQSLQCFQRRGE